MLLKINILSRILIIAWKILVISCQITIVPEVTIEEGTLRGATLMSRGGKKYHAFKGIRFVEKPERFKVAERAKPWEGVRDATDWGSPCTQQYPSSIGALMGTVGKEDCLFLNVFTSHENEEKQLPVMVFIHGGAFIIGSSNQMGSDYMMDENIVLVTFNYRLAAFGFLYFEDDLIPGNLAMKDQVAALQWVQRNIKHFGGNPNQVTLFGESAGAVSVHLMMLSPMARGLFQQAIIQSGSAISPWAYTDGPKVHGTKFAAAVGCPTGNHREMIDCLRTVDSEEMAGVQAESQWSTLPEYHWAPVVEVGAGVNASNGFLTESPVVLLAKRQLSNNVPVIMGVNKNEGAAIFSGFILNDEEVSEELNDRWNELAPLAFFYLDENFRVTPRFDEASYKIRDFYFGPHHVGLSTEQRLTDVFSDRYFIHGAYHAVKIHAAMAPTFIYQFTFHVGSSILHTLGYKNFEPPTHLDDVPYLFPFPFKETLSPPEEDFSKKFVKLWASFAITGRPEATWGAATVWPMTNVSDHSLTWYRIAAQTQLLSDPYAHRVKFWDDLLSNELRS